MMTAPKLMECVLTNCKGRVDDLLPLYLQLSVQWLIEFQPDSRFLQDLLMGVVINGLIYDADQTAKHLQPALPIVMEKLCNMLELRSKSSKKRKHFLRVPTRKSSLGLMALMQSQEANNQNLLNEQSLMHLMKLLVSLLEDLRHQIESENSQYQDSLKAYLENAAKTSRKRRVRTVLSRHRDDEDFEEDENEDELTPQMRYKQALDKVKASGNAAAPLDQSKWENDFSDSDDSEGLAEELTKDR